MLFKFGKYRMSLKQTTGILTNYGIQIFLTRLLLDVCFYEYVISAFTHSNYKYAFSYANNMFLYLVSWIIFIPSIVLSEKWFRSESPSSTVLQYIYMIQFIPFTTMFGASCFSWGFSFYTIFYWIILGIWVYYLLDASVQQEENNQVSYQENTILFEAAITVISGLAVLYFGYACNFRINLNILNAYDLREDARNISRVAGSTYLLGLSRILIPTGLVYSIRKKKILMLIAFLTFFILDYSFDGSKTLFFICIIAILVSVFYNIRMNKYIPFLLNIFLIIGYIEAFNNPLPIIYRLVIRRLFFVPNVINNAYYDFMQSHSPNMFSNLLRFLGINTSYDASYVIGEQYFHAPSMSANTGTVGDALWQFKYLGFLILPVLIVILLKCLDNSTKNISFEMIIIPCLVFAYYLNNSSFTAACFSHGLVFFCIVIQFYKCRRFRQQE